MLKKSLMMCCLALLIPFSTFAISLNELESNPDRYEKYGEDLNCAVFQDKYSVKSLRYSPPFYTIQVIEYIVSYNNSSIVEVTQIYNYDYNRSFERLDREISAKNKYWSVEKIIEEVRMKKREDSGISCSSVMGSIYALDGSLLYPSPESKSPTASKLKAESWGGLAASIAFEKYYGIVF